MIKLFIIATYIILQIQAAQIILQCQQTVITECPSKYKYNITGYHLNTKYCIPEGRTCNTSISSIMNVSLCQTDFRNNVCSTRVCIQSGLPPLCLNGLTSCPSSNNVGTFQIYEYLYGNCTSIQGCKKCLNTLKNNITITQQKCLGTLWQIKNKTSKINLSSNFSSNVTKTNGYDYSGLNCDCMTQNNITVNICTANYQILALQQIGTWLNFGSYLFVVVEIVTFIGLVIY